MSKEICIKMVPNKEGTNKILNSQWSVIASISAINVPVHLSLDIVCDKIIQLLVHVTLNYFKMLTKTF